MTRCRSAINVHFAHMQSLQRQYRLCPLRALTCFCVNKQKREKNKKRIFYFKQTLNETRTDHFQDRQCLLLLLVRLVSRPTSQFTVRACYTVLHNIT